MKIRKLSLVVLLLAVVMLSIPGVAGAIAGDTFSSGGVDYEVQAGGTTVYVTGADYMATGTLTIPSTAATSTPSYKVTGIDISALEGNDFTAVVLPSTLRFIGESAFENCDNLTAITVPAGVKTIDPYAFSYCNLLASATLPDSATDLGTHLFRSSTMLKSVRLPAGLKDLPNSIFNNCTALKNVKLPSTLQTISRAAFMGSGLRWITLPSKLWYIGDRAFENCDALVGNATYGMTIPSSVMYLGSRAFYDSDMLKVVTNKMSATAIRYQAFADMNMLEKINIPGKVIVVGYAAFQDDSALKVMYIPASVTTFETDSDTGSTDVFDGCSSLTKISIGKGMRVIPAWFATGCDSLHNIYIPEGVVFIDGGAFHGNDALKSIRIPSTVRYVGPDAFGDASNLASVCFYSSVPPKVSAYTFDGANPAAIVHAPAGAWPGITKFVNRTVKHDIAMVLYYLNGGTNHAMNKRYVMLPQAIQAPTRTGYVFKGWYAKPDFTGASYTKLNLTNVKWAPVRLYAKWAAE